VALTLILKQEASSDHDIYLMKIIPLGQEWLKNAYGDFQNC